MIPKAPTTLGGWLRRRRAELGLEQREAAKKLGVSTVSLSRWECDKIIPKVQYLKRISKFLGFDVVEKLGLVFD